MAFRGDPITPVLNDLGWDLYNTELKPLKCRPLLGPQSSMDSENAAERSCDCTDCSDRITEGVV